MIKESLVSGFMHVAAVSQYDTYLAFITFYFTKNIIIIISINDYLTYCVKHLQVPNCATFTRFHAHQ